MGRDAKRHGGAAPERRRKRDPAPPPEEGEASDDSHPESEGHLPDEEQDQQEESVGSSGTDEARAAEATPKGTKNPKAHSGPIKAGNRAARGSRNGRSRSAAPSQA